MWLLLLHFAIDCAGEEIGREGRIDRKRWRKREKKREEEINKKNSKKFREIRGRKSKKRAVSYTHLTLPTKRIV